VSASELPGVRSFWTPNWTPPATSRGRQLTQRRPAVEGAMLCGVSSRRSFNGMRARGTSSPAPRRRRSRGGRTRSPVVPSAADEQPREAPALGRRAGILGPRRQCVVRAPGRDDLVGARHEGHGVDDDFCQPARAALVAESERVRPVVDQRAQPGAGPAGTRRRRSALPLPIAEVARPTVDRVEPDDARSMRKRAHHRTVARALPRTRGSRPAARDRTPCRYCIREKQ
jgi:hypothetical protein